MGCTHLPVLQLTVLSSLILLINLSAFATAISRRALLVDSSSGANLDLLDGIVIPAAITVPSGNVLHFAVSAEGQQNYAFNGTAWVLQNATAKLYGSRGHSAGVVGRHFYLPEPDAKGGRPTWEISGSRVTGKGIASVSVDARSITWNLLEATSHGVYL